MHFCTHYMAGELLFKFGKSMNFEGWLLFGLCIVPESVKLTCKRKLNWISASSSGEFGNLSANRKGDISNEGYQNFYFKKIWDLVLGFYNTYMKYSESLGLDGWDVSLEINVAWLWYKPSYFLIFKEITRLQPRLFNLSQDEILPSLETKQKKLFSKLTKKQL